MKVVIVGGGIVGLSTAYFLINAGHEVTVIDKANLTDNCSYGNAGYVCPSHFVPLATPGIVKQGLKWMWNSKSPFYVQPRWDSHLLDWGLKFMRAANPEQVAKAAIPLRDIAILSKKMYEDWTQLPNLNFTYQQKGLLEIFQTEKGAMHAEHMLHKAHELGLSNTEWLSKEALQALEPQTTINALGALHFKCDAHLYPNQLMQQLLTLLKVKGVTLVENQEVVNFETSGTKLTKLITAEKIYEADQVVIAAGSWSRALAAKLDLTIPIMPGRGYSITYQGSPYQVNYPAVLIEGRVAITPLDNQTIRFGGTMEITSTLTPPKLNRVQGIIDAVKRYYPDFAIPTPSMDQVWYGFRPCSADGLPYLGRTQKWKNLILATGHSMVGLSLGAGTGKLVSELVDETKLSMDISAFNPDRFA